MNKRLCLLIFLIFPIIVFSQDQPQVLKDFEGTILNMHSSVILDNQVNVSMVLRDDENFDLVAVSADLKLLWRATLKGVPLGFGNFKGNIVAIAATDLTQYKGYSSSDLGYMVDSKTGSVLVSKEIFHGSDKFQEKPSVYFDKSGSVCVLAINQNAVARKIMTMSRTDKNAHLTQDLTIVSFDEKLEPALTIKPVLPGDALIGVACNSNNNIFVAWLKNKSTVNIVKYAAGKTEASSQMSQNLNIGNVLDKDHPEEDFSIFSSQDGNGVYCTSMRKSSGDAVQFTLIRNDFKNNTHNMSVELFDKELLKNIAKSFMAEGANYPSPDLGYAPDLAIKFADEYNGKLFIGMSSKQYSYSSHATFIMEGALLIGCYDFDLKSIFKQVLPSGYSAAGHSYTTGHYFDKGFLYTVANLTIRPFLLNAIYGKLDVQTGKWQSIRLLSKHDIGNGNPCEGACTLWYSNQLLCLTYL